MVGNYLKALFLDTSKNITPTKLNFPNLKCTFSVGQNLFI